MHHFLARFRLPNIRTGRILEPALQLPKYTVQESDLAGATQVNQRVYWLSHAQEYEVARLQALLLQEGFQQATRALEIIAQKNRTQPAGLPRVGHGKATDNRLHQPDPALPISPRRAGNPYGGTPGAGRCATCRNWPANWKVLCATDKMCLPEGTDPTGSLRTSGNRLRSGYLHQPHLGIPDELRTRRKPLLMPRSDGTTQPRIADRQSAAPMSQGPPRRTRSEPTSGPRGSVTGPSG